MRIPKPRRLVPRAHLGKKKFRFLEVSHNTAHRRQNLQLNATIGTAPELR